MLVVFVCLGGELLVLMRCDGTDVSKAEGAGLDKSTACKPFWADGVTFYVWPWPFCLQILVLEIHYRTHLQFPSSSIVTSIARAVQRKEQRSLHGSRVLPARVFATCEFAPKISAPCVDGGCSPRRSVIYTT